MKVSQLTKVLKRAGCSIQRHGKEHDIWFSPITGKTDAVPRHGSKELGKGILQKLLKNFSKTCLDGKFGQVVSEILSYKKSFRIEQL